MDRYFCELIAPAPALNHCLTLVGAAKGAGNWPMATLQRIPIGYRPGTYAIN